MSAQVFQISAKTRRHFEQRMIIRKLIEGRDAVVFREVEAAMPGGRIGFERVRKMLSAEGFHRPRRYKKGDIFRRVGTCNWREEKALCEKWYPERQIMWWDRDDEVSA